MTSLINALYHISFQCGGVQPGQIYPILGATDWIYIRSIRNQLHKPQVAFSYAKYRSTSFHISSALWGMEKYALNDTLIDWKTFLEDPSFYKKEHVFL